jgi:hypothetical protein
MKALGIIAAVTMAVGGMCPLVHVTFIGNWNYFQIDPVLGIIFYMMVVLGIITSWLEKPQLMRFVGWAVLGWVILTLAAVWFKSHDVYSFIHFRKLINLAAGMVKYRWGWLLIIAGALSLVTTRPKLSSEYNKTDN